MVLPPGSQSFPRVADFARKARRSGIRGQGRQTKRSRAGRQATGIRCGALKFRIPHVARTLQHALRLGSRTRTLWFANAQARSKEHEMHDTNLSLADAFGKFGAKPASRLRGLSAIAADGAVVLNCSPPYFGHPAKGVLRYEDRLSRDPEGPKDRGLLSQHLALATGGELPLRMSVQTPSA